MSSFILHFRPWLLALAGLAAIECAYYATAHPPRARWNSFLDLQFTQTESFQRLVAYDKIVAFEDADPDIIQVGDSSGLHGVQPPVVMSHLDGHRYLNMSVATNLGYSGYYNLARLQLERSPNARYLVLYTSPIGGVPRKLLWDEDQKLMAQLIYNEFISGARRLIQLPTLAARPDVISYAYYWGSRFRQRGGPQSLNRGYLAFLSAYRASNGWTRETDVEGDIPANIYQAILPGVDAKQALDSNVMRAVLSQFPKVTDERFFDWKTFSEVSYFDLIYGAFADLARQHGVKLVVIFNPVPESSRRPEFDAFMDWKAIGAGLERLRIQHPDVVVTSIDYWPDDRFSVFSHIGAIHSEESSHRVGEIMRGVIKGEPPLRRANAAAPAARPASVEIDFAKYYCGYGWTDQAGATVAFPLQYVGPRGKAWLYTALVPGPSYKVRGVFRADDAAIAQRIELKAQDAPVRKVASGVVGDALYAEWLVPAAAVATYRGWLKLEFDVGGASREGQQGGRTVRFSSVTAVPVDGG